MYAKIKIRTNAAVNCRIRASSKNLNIAGKKRKFLEIKIAAVKNVDMK